MDSVHWTAQQERENKNVIDENGNQMKTAARWTMINGELIQEN